MNSPRRLSPGDPALPQVLALIRESFGYMDGRISPPSSMHRLTAAAIARAGEVWVLGAPPRACVFLTPKPGRLYLGKLAVNSQYRGKGLARQLVEHAAARARDLGLPVLELQTRIELTGNHAAFARMGFVKTGETAHPGLRPGAAW